MRLRNKVAVITGGASGIGSSEADIFVKGMLSSDRRNPPVLYGRNVL